MNNLLGFLFSTVQIHWGVDSSTMNIQYAHVVNNHFSSRHPPFKMCSVLMVMHAILGKSVLLPWTELGIFLAWCQLLRTLTHPHEDRDSEGHLRYAVTFDSEMSKYTFCTMYTGVKFVLLS